MPLSQNMEKLQQTTTNGQYYKFKRDGDLKNSKNSDLTFPKVLDCLQQEPKVLIFVNVIINNNKRFTKVRRGVISGIGKGIFASSLGFLLKTFGLKVTAIKIDPYMNIDAGTMSPIEHGEVFVLNDGGEVDLDLGNYERFLDVTLTRDNTITAGKVYLRVIEKERKGGYLGKTVQVVPHITDTIQEWIEKVAKVPVDQTNQEPDICIIELGGTVGDIESAPFVEAMRQFQFRVGSENFALGHVSLVPIIGTVGEQKSKPTQTTIRELRALGLSPDLIACRCSIPLKPDVKNKISMFFKDVVSIYHVPSLLKEQGVLEFFIKRLGLDKIPISQNQKKDPVVNIVLVGKYTDLHDSYHSVIKSLEHSVLKCRRKLVLKLIEASHLEDSTNQTVPDKYKESWDTLKSADGILVPGGFGNRGIEGKILAARCARENKIPFLGICLGLQIAVIEFARNVCNLKCANSEEFDPKAKHQVVINMPEISTTEFGGTMRLGLKPTIFQEETKSWSKLHKLYDKQIILERHRHRYEVNPEYVAELESNGLYFVGRDELNRRMEIMELKDHPYYVGTQFHPEYLSRPLNPSPPFL
ncbi:1498_t:CDS:10, partial [Entrophospora sp. SA101]